MLYVVPNAGSSLAYLCFLVDNHFAKFYYFITIFVHDTVGCKKKKKLFWDLSLSILLSHLGSDLIPIEDPSWNTEINFVP